MNNNKNPLFNQKLLYEYYKKINIPEVKIKALNEKVFNLPENAITMGKKSGNEENVKNKVVLQFLKFLDYDEQMDINYEESSLRKSIDVTIRVSEDDKTPKALIEVKYWKKDLDKLNKDKHNRYKSDVQQGLIYAHERGIDWFIITNGYEWRFYKTYISGQIVYNFYEEFNWESLHQLETLQKFYLLCSKDSFIKDRQNKLFSETELLKEKINEEIFDILVNCRSELFSDIFRNNKDFLNVREIMEIGQKILDRFVFIRFTEDNNLFSSKILIKFLKDWKGLHKNVKEKIPLFSYIKDLFSYIREGNVEDDIFGYDGELFDKDKLIEKIEVDNSVIENIVNKLYKYPNGKYIDFSEIPVDILGQIYEKYLALSLNIKEEGSSVILEEKSTKKIRKKTGIYYTPKYIVHFIIENTILQKLEDNLNILPELKILDPACGSGAFLSQAYDLLYLKYEEYNEIITVKTIRESEKLDLMQFAELMEKYKKEFNKSILTNNLFGVDINPESVEITKMSLWFKTAQMNIPLNKLEANIKCGDSLIDNPELSRDKAFNWDANFPDVFNEGGFDMIIGNPPYFKIKKESPLTQIDEYNEIKMAFVNASALFLNRAFKLMKNNGFLGFIVPKQIAFTSSWQKLRNKIFNQFKILYLIDCGKAFKGVLLEQVIIILEKESNNKDNIIKLGKILEKNIIIDGEVRQDLCQNEDLIFLQYNSIINNIKEKVVKNSVLLGDISDMQLGLGINRLKNIGVFTEEKSKESLIIVSGIDIQRFFLRSCLYFDKRHPELKKYQKRIISPPKKKIVAQRIVAHIRDHIKITATIEEISSLSLNTVLEIFPKDLGDIYYILGILNSELMSYYFYKFVYNNAIRSMDFYPAYASRTPIFKGSREEKKNVSEIVKDLVDLYQKFLDYNKNVQKIYEKYAGVKKTKLRDILLNNFYKLLIKSNKKIKVRNLGIETKDDLFILKINDKDFLKLQIKDPIKSRYIYYFLDSLEIDLLNIPEKNIFQAFKELEIDDIDDIQAVNTVAEELEHFKSKITLKNKIMRLENKLNEKIYELYRLDEEEIKYMKESFY